MPREDPSTISAARILHVLREHPSIRSYAELCEHFNASPTSLQTVNNRISSLLMQLEAAGLVAASTPLKDVAHGEAAELRLTNEWHQIANLLNLSLTNLLRLERSRGMYVEPFHGFPAYEAVQDPPELFVAMPFADALVSVYENHIKKVARSLNIRVARADDLFAADNIIDTVWCSLNAAQVVLADCSGRNPNVFYEVGLAHAVGKKVFLITQSHEDVPFDLRHIRYLKYENTPDGMQQFEDSLAASLQLFFP